MLLSVGRRRYIPDDSSDYFHNYYEQMVLEQTLRSNDRANHDPDFLADVACVALNRLPPRYVRHDVDMTFFLSPGDLEDMINRVVKAVNEAVEYVESREVDNHEQEDPTTDNKP
ncbi:hypothetical protein TDB9533_04283 [Thalassocella blandensis]|nr:hypothetical protein TDB9533_04283 [Thalassocella blandensis]